MSNTIIYGFAAHIMAHWDEWEAEAGLAAQAGQDDRNWSETMHRHLEKVLTDLVELAAQQCEGRALARTSDMTVYNEAIKCGEQIRHNLLVREIESASNPLPSPEPHDAR